ncbi:hypothetical protein BS47DRAFT_1358769 [Hydnum rufescens UP504]|uniref:Uncharacterized protein n=1 Tax=Hydnum rufescens UP504 TaxID=1448309 RepID=A0A9P6E160_9AGAM|nr:hypothetical protein BS47DRAFT_1358769 [Hydnum rufescens UP504]
MSPLPPDTNALEYRGLFLKPRSALGLSLSSHGSTLKPETNDQQGMAPPQTSSFSLHPHPLDYKLPPLTWVQTLIQKRHPSHPKPDENIKTAGKLVYPEQLPDLHSSGNDQQATMSCDLAKPIITTKAQ